MMDSDSLRSSAFSGYSPARGSVRVAVRRPVSDSCVCVCV